MLVTIFGRVAFVIVFRRAIVSCMLCGCGIGIGGVVVIVVMVG